MTDHPNDTTGDIAAWGLNRYQADHYYGRTLRLQRQRLAHHSTAGAHHHHHHRHHRAAPAPRSDLRGAPRAQGGRTMTRPADALGHDLALIPRGERP